jgi:hypothetical protein
MKSRGVIKNRIGRVPRRLKNPPPSVVVLGVALSLLALGVVGNYLSSRDSADSYRYPRVVYVDEEGKLHERRVKDLPAVLSERPVFDGEVFHTSDRLAEASVLAGNSVAYAATRGQLVDGRGMLNYPASPADHRALLSGMSAAGAMPPGMELRDNMTVVSPSSVLSVRYQRDPLSVEVVSIARDVKSGPALLIRLPDEAEQDALGVRYYQAQSLENPVIPGAFVPASAVIKLGWLPQLLKGDVANGAQYAQAQQWLASQAEEVRRAGGGGR